jgi:hypothetical protein
MNLAGFQKPARFEAKLIISAARGVFLCSKIED